MHLMRSCGILGDWVGIMEAFFQILAFLGVYALEDVCSEYVEYVEYLEYLEYVEYSEYIY